MVLHDIGLTMLGQSVQTFVDWLTGAYRNGFYADFKSCSTRKEWIGFVLFQILVYIAITLFGVLTVIASDRPNEVVTWPIYVVTAMVMVFWLFSFVPSLAITVRRLHDIGLSGWWSLIFFISPFISGIESFAFFQYFFVVLGIFMMLMPSKVEGNQYRNQ